MGGGGGGCIIGVYKSKGGNNIYCLTRGWGFLYTGTQGLARAVVLGPGCGVRARAIAMVRARVVGSVTQSDNLIMPY